MNRTIRVIAAIAAVYLCAAFVFWEANPGEWGADGRYFRAFFASIAALFAFLWEDLF